MAARSRTGPSAGTSQSDNSDVPNLPPADSLPGAQNQVSVPNDNPMEQMDPDGVPLSVLSGHKEKPSQAMIDAYLKQQATAIAQDRDWLLRSYEERKQARAQKENDSSPNLYTELTSNKALANLAGLPSSDDDGKSALRTGDAAKGSNGPELRKDADSTAADEEKKLAQPLIASHGLKTPNFAAPMPFQFSTSFDNVVPNVPVPAKVKEAEEMTDLDTPGAISDKTGGATNGDLNLDFLPGESLTSAKGHQDANSPAELALPMDSSQLHKDETLSLQVAQPYRPGADRTAMAAPGPSAPSPNPDKESDPNAPVPVSKVPIPSTRAPISNPFDILNR